MITVTQLNKIGEDERGATHYFSTDRTGQFIVAYRKAGSASGRHYHKGIAPHKNPEQIIIMQGEAMISWFDTRTSNHAERESIHVQAPVMVEIAAWAWHEVMAVTGIIVFELNGLEDAKHDTFRMINEGV
jgi:hypothetical protein